VCDLEGEPTFVGALTMEVVGYVADDAPAALRLGISAKVVGEPRSEPQAPAPEPEPMTPIGEGRNDDLQAGTQ
jgi:hypothetical protein